MILTTLALMIIIVGGVAYALTKADVRQSKGGLESNRSIEPPAQTPSQSTTSDTATPGFYADYNEGVIVAGTKLLFFYAPGSSQCQALDEDIRERGVPSGVTIIKVDYDTNQELRKKYGIAQPTTVVRVNSSGKLVKKFVARDDPSLAAVTKNLLEP